MSSNFSSFPNFPTPATVQTVSSLLSTSSQVTIAAGSWTASGLTVNITPTSSSNKVLVLGYISVNTGNPTGTNTADTFIELRRGSTPIFIGDTAGSRVSVSGMRLNSTSSSDGTACIPFVYIDSPATTSSLTYTVQVTGTGGSTANINKTTTDANTTVSPRTTSSITVIELSQ